jgi:5-methylcytosine-specific restriction endonuclease McrBC regulatory subunit McrC
LLFCDEIKEIFRIGLSRRYIETEEPLKILRGRPLWETNFPWSPDYSNEIFCRHYRLTYDNLDNKLIFSGLRRALTLIRDNDVRKIALKHFKIFTSLTSGVRPEISMFDKAKKEYNRLNEHYFIAHSLSKMFLFGMRPESLFEKGGIVVSGLVLDMAMLFEMFVEKLLSDFFVGRGFKIRSQGPDRNALLDEEGQTYASIRPDFEIYKNDRIIGVIDAKYKTYWKGLENNNKPTRKISNEDLYQLFFYQQRIQRKHNLSNAPIAIIASPLPAEDERGDSPVISERFRRIFWQAGSDKAGDVRLILIPTTQFLRLLTSGIKSQEAIERIHLDTILKSFLN